MSSSRCAGVRPGAGRALHDLLVASLHRAVALEEVHDPAVTVRQDLDLQVPGAADEALEVDVVLAEGGVRLAPCREQGGLELALGLDRAHAAPAAAPAGLEYPGESHVSCERERRRRVHRQRVGGRHRGHAGAGGDGARGDLVAEQAQRLRPGADEGDLRLGAGPPRTSGDSERKP